MSSTTATYTPLSWQVEPWRDKSRVMLLTGGAGGGKSRLASEKMHGYCLHYPGAVCVALRKAQEFARKSVVFALKTAMGDALNNTVHYGDAKGIFEYDNGSMIFIAGMKDEQQREALRSIAGDGSLDLIWGEEANALIEKDHNELLGRLRGTAADWRQIIYTTNPGPPNHWINRRLIVGGEASVYRSYAGDNPHNPDDYAGTLATMTGVQYKRLVLGQWVRAEGAVYDTFNRDVHVQERDSADFQQWAMTFDEGYTNPAVILQVGKDADGRLHVAREFYERGKLQDTVVSEAVTWNTAQPVTLSTVDAAAAGLVAALRDAGLPAISSKGRVLDGIQAVQNMLKVQGDGKPRLTVDPSCINLINEFESYVWRQSADGGQRDEPEKGHDHALDALRYLIIYWQANRGSRLLF